MPLPPNFLPQHPWDNGEMVVRDEQLLPWPRTPEKVREMNAEYYRYISYLDSQIGRILDALDASPHAKNTIVVFSADSGVARGSHGLIGKQNVYEHSMRVPLIIGGPGIPAGKRTRRHVLPLRRAADARQAVRRRRPEDQRRDRPIGVNQRPVEAGPANWGFRGF